MCATTLRLITLLRIVEREPAPFGVLGDDALLDAWFGTRSPLAGQAPRPDPLEDAPQPVSP